MVDFDDLKDGIVNYKEQHPLGFKIALILIILFFISLLVIVFQSGNKTVVLDEGDKFVPDQTIVTPDAPDVEKDYFPSRSTEKQWSENEILNYFTVPEAAPMTNLEKENDKIVNDILGASL